MLFAPIILALAAFQDAPPRHVPLVAPPFDHEKLAAFVDALAQPVVERQGVPGLTIAVAEGGTVIFAKGYGFADAQNAVPARVETRYELGTLTRQFTAVAMLQLADAKKLSLDDALSKYLPAFPCGARTITLRALLSNTSGIPSYAAVKAKHAAIAKPGLDEAEFCACFADVPFAFEPGEDFALDSANYVLLSMVVAKVAGQPFLDYVKTHILDPVGLASTSFARLDALHAGLVVPCAGTLEEHDFELPLGSALPYPTQSLSSNAIDLVKWQNALFTRAVFSEDSAWTIIRPTKLADGNSTLYGYALQMSMVGDFKNYAHTGGTHGSRVRLSYYSLPRITVVVLANCASAPVERIERDIGRYVLALPSPSCTEVALSATEAARCAGTYQVATRRIEVEVRAGKLWYSAPDHTPERLIHVGALSFAFESDLDARVEFPSGEAACASFTILRGGFETHARRVN